MKYSRLAITLAAALALPQAVPVLAADITAAPAASTQTQAPVTRGYLGVTIDRLPEPVRAQLPEAIPREQGLLVEQVMQDSPAARAGLQPFDILLQYNDQKLFSPEQLTRLVGSDSGGQPVKLTPTEFNLLRALAEHPGHALTRMELIENGLGYSYEGLERTVDTHIKNLRRKLAVAGAGDDLVETVFGVGYRLVAGDLA